MIIPNLNESTTITFEAGKSYLVFIDVTQTDIEKLADLPPLEIDCDILFIPYIPAPDRITPIFFIEGLEAIERYIKEIKENELSRTRQKC